MEIDMERNGWNLSLKKKYKEYKKENCEYALLPLCHGFLLIYIHIKRAKSYKAPEMKKFFLPSERKTFFIDEVGLGNYLEQEEGDWRRNPFGDEFHMWSKKKETEENILW